jgi:hypothetical protein
MCSLGMKGGWWTGPCPSSFTSQKRAPQYPHSWRLGGPQTQYGCFVEETIYLPCQRFNFSVLQPLSQSLCQLRCSGSLWEDKFWIHKTVFLMSENTVVDQRESVWYAPWCIRKNCSYSKSFTRQKAKLYIIALHTKKAIAPSILQDTVNSCLL